MAHPFHEHGEHRAGRARVHTLFKGLATGGRATASAAPQKRATGGSVKSDVAVTGRASGGRLDKLARGGKAKGKKHGNHVNIAIVNPKSGPEAGAAPGGMPIPPARPPMGAGPPGMPPGLPPGGPPGMPPKPPGMMKRGGRMAKRAMGGKVKMTGGGDSGVGRLDKVKAYGKNARKG